MFICNTIIGLYVLALLKSETVFLTDRTNDGGRREQEAELPSTLVFELWRRGSEDPVILHLQENQRLNQHAPMYRSVPDLWDGSRLEEITHAPQLQVSFKFISVKNHLYNNYTFGVEGLEPPSTCQLSFFDGRIDATPKQIHKL